MEEVRKLAAHEDPVVRARESSALLAYHQDVVTELSRIRREAVQELITRGLSYSQIAEKIGVSRSRIGQITKSGPLSERAFLGDGSLTVVVGEKKEQDQGRPVIAVETSLAFDRLKNLASSYQLDASQEPVPPPGIFDLNRDNLVVLSGPRLFPMVGQILASDPSLRFEQDEDGAWQLRDLQTNQIYRSDPGKAQDFGYLGRLPRPDGRGLFLVAAGLHAASTQGVIAYLETSLAELYAEVKKARFSMIIECSYDPADHNRVISARQASPIYKRS